MLGTRYPSSETDRQLVKHKSLMSPLPFFKEAARVVMIERGCLAQSCPGWTPTRAPSSNRRTSGCDLETLDAFDKTAVPR